MTPSPRRMLYLLSLGTSLTLWASQSLPAEPKPTSDPHPAAAPSAPQTAEQRLGLPPGVKLLSPIPDPDRRWPSIRIRTIADPVPPIIAVRWLEEPIATPPLDLKVIDWLTAKRDPGITFGPSVAQQLGVLGQPGVTAAQPIPARVAWKPTSAYPPGDPNRPYPWNPATFSPTTATAWSPTSGFSDAIGVSAGATYRWPKPVFDATWTPTDTWGRDLSTPDSVREKEAEAAAGEKDKPKQ